MMDSSEHKGAVVFWGLFAAVIVGSFVKTYWL